MNRVANAGPHAIGIRRHIIKAIAFKALRFAKLRRETGKGHALVSEGTT